VVVEVLYGDFVVFCLSEVHVENKLTSELLFERLLVHSFFVVIFDCTGRVVVSVYTDCKVFAGTRRIFPLLGTARPGYVEAPNHVRVS
jgi:hypothetical protein